MGDGTGIEWTDATWNPVRGCSRVSEGCRNCYAERVAARFSGPGQPYEGLATLHSSGEPNADFGDKGPPKARPRWTGVVRMVPERLSDPLRWKKPRRIFVNSMSDLFHERLSSEDIASVFGVMAAAPQHTFQVLTKRAERMREWFRWVGSDGTNAEGCALAICDGAAMRAGATIDLDTHVPKAWPLPNVWLGVSVEDQETADERIPILLETPAAVRFVSYEPALGSLDLHAIQIPGERPRLRFSALQRQHDHRYGSSDTTLDWVIVGCESGPGRRRMPIGWACSAVDQCVAAGVSVFVKQLDLGGQVVKDMSRFPFGLQIREYPR